MYLGGRVSFLQYKVIGYAARDLDRFRKLYQGLPPTDGSNEENLIKEQFRGKEQGYGTKPHIMKALRTW